MTKQDFDAMSDKDKIKVLHEALSDMVDGLNPHDISGDTGLPMDRCEYIYKLAHLFSS